jgi:hypothetical protein
MGVDQRGTRSLGASPAPGPRLGVLVITQAMAMSWRY